MALVWIAGRADAALELDAAALLNDVRGFVRSCMQIGAATQHDVIAGRVCIGAHGLRGCGCVGTRVSLDRRYVVTTERTLDRVREGQARRRCGHAPLRRSMDGALVALLVLVSRALLHRGRRSEDLLDQRLLAGRRRVRPRLGSRVLRPSRLVCVAHHRMRARQLPYSIPLLVVPRGLGAIASVQPLPPRSLGLGDLVLCSITHELHEPI